MRVNIKKLSIKNTISSSPSQGEAPTKEPQAPTATENMPDRAPWYIVLCRIVVFLCILGFCFVMCSCIILGGIYLVDLCFSFGIIPWLISFTQQQPVLSAIIVFVLFVAFGLYFMSEFVRIHCHKETR